MRPRTTARASTVFVIALLAALALIALSPSPAAALRTDDGGRAGRGRAAAPSPTCDPALTGTADNELIVGTAGDDHICGGGGNDVLLGMGGDDIVEGEGGNDYLQGGAGDDTLDGGPGTDTASFSDDSSGASTLHVSLTGSAAACAGSPCAHDTDGGVGHDSLVSITNVHGSPFADRLTGGSAQNVLYGLGGPDLISGGGENDRVYGNSAADELFGGPGLDWVVGGAGADTANGSEEADAVSGGAEDDTIWGGAGADVMVGGTGPDSMLGQGGPDQIRGHDGTSGNDAVQGKGQTDTCNADAGDTKKTCEATLGPNTAPDAADDPAAGSEAAYTIGNDERLFVAGPGVLGNDSDADGEALSATVDTGPANGTVTLFADGSFLYDPADSFSGTDTFTYAVNDGSASSAPATVSITVLAGNDTPDAVDDTFTVSEDSGPNGLNVLGNDTDGDGDPLDITAVSDPANGTTSITGTFPNEQVSYTPDPNYCNDPPGTTPDTFTYSIDDGNGGSDTATVSVTVTCVDEPPNAVDDSATVVEDSSNNAINVLANDTSPDGGTDITAVSDPANGTAAITGTAPNEQVSYTPDPNYCNDPAPFPDDTFTYTLQDTDTDTDTATVSVTVTCVDDPADAVNDARTITEDDPATQFTVLSNDCCDQPLEITNVTDPAGGTATVVQGSPDTISYDSDLNYCNDPPGNTPDTFDYTIQDFDGDTDTATVSVTVTCVNDPPVADNEGFNTPGNRAVGNTTFSLGVTGISTPRVFVTGSVLDGDTDVESPGSLTVTGTSNLLPAGTTLNMNSDGTFTALPPAGSIAQIQFDYTVQDPEGATDVGNVVITVTEMVWYVDNSGPNGDGRSNAPFNTFASLTGGGGVDNAADYIFVYQGSGNYTGGLTLESTQRVFGQPHGLSIDGHTLVAASGSNPTITNAAGSALALAQNNEIQGVNLGSSSSAALSAPVPGTANIGTVTGVGINNPTGGGMSIDAGTVNAPLTELTSSGGTFGVIMNNVTGSISAPTGSITNPTTASVQITGGTADFTYGGTITDDLGTVISISNTTGGTKDFNGAITDGNDVDGSGISLLNNAGATIRFDGGLTLSTGSNPAFAASGPGPAATSGGTVVVTDPAGSVDNNITSTTGTALRIQDTTIGSDGVTFESISANGSASGGSRGIVLENTGSLAGLTVTGDGSNAQNGSGGTIANINGADGPTGLDGVTGFCLKTSTPFDGVGIFLSNTRNPVLRSMTLRDFQNFGILGFDITGGLTLNGVTVTALSSPWVGTNAATDDGPIHLCDVTGTATVTNVSATRGNEDNFVIHNDSVTLTALNVSNSTFSNTNTAPPGNNGFLIRARGTGNVTATFTSPNTFANNFANGLQAATENSGVIDLTINGGTFTSNNIGVNLSNNTVPASATTNFSFDVTGATITGNVAGTSASPINVFSGALTNANTTMMGTIDANTIDNNSSGTGPGINVDSNGNGKLTVAVTDNLISEIGTALATNIGINVIAGNGAPAVNATITGNTVSVAGDFTQGILVQKGKSVDPNTSGVTLCARVGQPSGFPAGDRNTITAAGTGSDDIRVRNFRGTALFQLQGYTGPATDTAAVAAFLVATNNIADASASNTSGLAGFGNGTCTTPS